MKLNYSDKLPTESGERAFVKLAESSNVEARPPGQPEKFSPAHASIVIGVHLLAAGAFFQASTAATVSFLATHFLFGCFGMTIANHRYFAHASFTTSPTFRKMLGVLATLNFQGGPLFWAAAHRVHHAFTNQPGDPHSADRGFAWSHLAWLFYRAPNSFSYLRARRHTPDLNSDPFLRFLEVNATRLNLAVILLAAAAIGGWAGRWDIFFWAVPFRIVVLWHTTWLINSYLHRGGWQSLIGRGTITMVDSPLVCLLLYGDGRHLSHHESPTLVTTSTAFRHLDIGFWVLRLLERLGVVTIPSSKLPKSAKSQKRSAA